MTDDLTAQIHQYLTSAPSSLFAQQSVEDARPLGRRRQSALAGRRRPSGEPSSNSFSMRAKRAAAANLMDTSSSLQRGLAPQPLWADRYPHGLSRQIIVYRWSDGETITPDDPSSLCAWAEAIGMLHTTPPDEVRRFSPHPVNLDFYWRIEQGSIAQIESWLAPSGLALSKLFQKLAVATTALVKASLPFWAAAQPTPVHGDLSRQHTLIERGRVLLLDWEMFGLGDPALDVARYSNVKRKRSMLNKSKAG